MDNSIKEFYVIRCNKTDNRYLSFINSSNKGKSKLYILECGQSDPNDLSTAIFFENEEDAEIAKTLYIKSDRVNPKYIDRITVETATLNDNNLYMKHNFKINTNGSLFQGYISINAFLSYANV